MSTMKRFAHRIAAAAVSVVMMFCVLVSFPSGTVAEETKDFAAMAEEVAFLINEERASADLAPLKIVPYLCDIACIRAIESVAKFSHDRPEDIGDYTYDDEGNKYYGFETAINCDLIPFVWAGENLARGNSTPKATFDQWKASEGHYQNIMNPNYTHLGVAVIYGMNADGKWNYYWETLFIGCGIDLMGQYLPERELVKPVSTGDINGDGTIDSFDLIMLNKFLDGRIELNKLQVESADLYDDGSVTAADADVLIGYILGENDTIPVKPRGSRG